LMVGQSVQPAPRPVNRSEAEAGSALAGWLAGWLAAREACAAPGEGEERRREGGRAVIGACMRPQ